MPASLPVKNLDFGKLLDDSERPPKRCKTMLPEVGERAPVPVGSGYGGEVLDVQDFLDATGKARAGVFRDFGLRRDRHAPNRMLANTWGGDSTCEKRHKVPSVPLTKGAKARGAKGTNRTKEEASSVRGADCIDAAPKRKRSWDTEEAFLVHQYLAKGVRLDLREQTSVVNKKIDVFLPSDSGFSRSKFFKVCFLCLARFARCWLARPFFVN